MIANVPASLIVVGDESTTGHLSSYSHREDGSLIFLHNFLGGRGSQKRQEILFQLFIEPISTQGSLHGGLQLTVSL